MKNILKDLLYKLLLLLLTAVSGYEMYTYENGIFGTVRDSAVIRITLAVFIFLTASSFIKNNIALLILSAAGGVALLIIYNDFGFLIALPLLLPCLFFSAVGKKKTDRICFFLGAVLNATAVIYGIIKIVISLSSFSFHTLLHPGYSALLNTACKGILLALAVFSVFCLRKSFHFTEKKFSSEKKKEDTALPEQYNTFWLFAAAAMIICAVYCPVSLAADNYCITGIIVWLAVMLFLYFEGDAVLHSFSAKDPNKTKRG